MVVLQSAPIADCCIWSDRVFPEGVTVDQLPNSLSPAFMYVRCILELIYSISPWQSSPELFTEWNVGLVYKQSCPWASCQIRTRNYRSTRIPRPIGEGGNGQWADCSWTLFKITRQPFWKRHSWQSLGFCLQPQWTCTWNLKLKFQSKLELHCRNHAIQKPKNLIWPPGSHLENVITENQYALTYIHKYFATEVWGWYSKPK